MSNALPVPPAAAVRTAYHEELNDGQRSALLSWLSFTGTFALTRAVTSSMAAGPAPCIAANRVRQVPASR